MLAVYSCHWYLTSDTAALGAVCCVLAVHAAHLVTRLRQTNTLCLALLLSLLCSLVLTKFSACA